MNDFTLRDHLQGSARFSFYRDNNLWYRTTDTSFLFPVPVNDIKGTLLVVEKSAFFKRWIIQQMEQ